MSFWSQDWPNCPKDNFFRKTIDLIFMYLLAPFIVQNQKKKKKKKNLEWIRVMTTHWAQNDPI